MQTNVFAWIRTVFAHLIIGCATRYPKTGNLRYVFWNYIIMSQSGQPKVCDFMLKMLQGIVKLGVFSPYYTIPLATCKEGEVCWSRESLSLLWTNWLECRKNPSPAVTSTTSNAQSRHVPRESHTTRMESSSAFCHTWTSVTFRVWRFILYYTIPLGTCKKGSRFSIQ